MNIDQAIFSYTYARVSGSSSLLSHIDSIAKKIILSTPIEMQNTLSEVFSDLEYEQKLRYIRDEDTHRKS
tara:strand:+ start:1697 stop:1906 length:210 start_codon:yes stop_codon:yes gene_type:complete